MTWLLLAAAAQLINAVVAILDKYIVTDEKILPKPLVFAFYSCLLSGVWILIYPLGFLPFHIPGIPLLENIQSPSLVVVALSFLAAYTFFIALVSLYTALKEADASDVMPVVGAISAVATFGLAYQFFDQTIAPNFIWGIIFLVLGTFVVSQLRFKRTVAFSALYAGVFFALHYITMKGLFNFTNFDDGFFWSRVMMVIFALTLLVVPSYYREIKSQTKSTGKKAGTLVFANKVLAGIAGIMILKATDLGDVAVVQALDGLKFVFILIIGIAIGHKTPVSCGENDCRRRDIIQKALAVAIISFGFLVLFI